MEALTVTHPHLAKKWDYDKNSPMTPDKITKGVSKKYWWKCEKGHSYSASPNFLGGCPVCSGRSVIPGVNDLLTTHPHLALEWDYQKNYPVTPDTIYGNGSGKKYWWKCEKGHSYDASTSTRNNGSGCAVCGNRRVLVGFNDLATTHPDIAKTWHPTKNGALLPTDVVSGTTKRAWWLCEVGHEWESVIRSRSNVGCPVCSNQVVIKGFNDLFTSDPHLKDSWSEKNLFSGYEVTRSSGKRVLWDCPKGHEWEAFVFNRIRHDCPTCFANSYSSKGEKELQDYIDGLVKGVERNFRGIKGVHEVDVFIPHKNIAVEYNGLYFHSEARKTDQKAHLIKYQRCREQGIQLIQIWEDDWLFRQKATKRLIAHKLGVAQTKKIPARKTTVENVSWTVAKTFLENNHIQGAATGSTYLGLRYENKLVALAVFKHRSDAEYELVRYATAETVVGGLGKLLAYIERTTVVRKIITFADHCISNGALYENLGFEKEAELAPDYRYKIGLKREHKFKYRKQRFEKDPALRYDKDLTERELAELNGLLRIWDAGKTRYVKNLTG